MLNYYVKETEVFIDKLIYGDHLTEARLDIFAINESIAQAVLECRPFSEKDARRVFSIKPKKRRKFKEIIDSDYDSWPLCTSKKV